ncbi:diguanylate cyclase [Sulfuricurvum sp.]|uniref:diguanylate cyclase n=1 Tax=Sulfuricurvum sp. TaxID=2025608 RepID=UPI00262AE73E|nr:diguanylate cyclase [Sulfuricurvum sp.]MDD2780763.1 diguanylate cyclase [Sulfuricurvum sp.]
MKNIKLKIILFLSLVIVSVSVIITTYNLYYEKQENQRRMSEAYDHVYRTYNETLQDSIRFYSSRAQANLRSPGVMEAFRAKDHDTLHRLVTPRWEVMQKENPWLVVLQFHNGDGSSLLRMHQPDVYGDKIASQRSMVAYVHKTAQQVAGFEEGRQGLAFRILIPAFDQGVYVGSVEFGIAAPYFTDKIYRFAGYNSFFFVNKNALGTFGRVAQPISVDNHIGMDIPSEFRPFIKQYALEHPKLENGVLSYRNQMYEVNILNTNDYQNKPIGAIMFIRSTNDFNAHIRHLLVASALIVLVLIVIMSIGIDRIYTYITEKMSFQKRYAQMILDSVPSPVIVTNGVELIAANNSFLGYLQYDNLEAFKKEHLCVCEYFESGDTDEYLMPTRNDKLWTEYMIEHPLKIHKAKITINNVTTTFEARLSVLKVNEETRYVVLFNDISMMQIQTMNDPLTQIPNRLHFTMVYRHLISMARRAEKPLTILFFDIDHFKGVNDRYGHLIGDKVLKQVSKLVSQRIRKSDIVARWGGEEFILLLPDTEIEEATRVAQMLRKTIDEEDFEEAGHITCSFGVATLESDEDGEHLLSRADELLYEAKSNGRNRVIS